MQGKTQRANRQRNEGTWKIKKNWIQYRHCGRGGTCYNEGEKSALSALGLRGSKAGSFNGEQVRGVAERGMR